MRLNRTIVLLALSTLFWSCREGDVPLVTTVPIPTAAPTATAPADSATPTGTPQKADLAGAFQVSPPASVNGVIEILPGGSVEVNAVLFRQPRRVVL